MQDKFLADFRNVLIEGGNKENLVSRIKGVVEEGYNCYVITESPEDYSGFMAAENVFLPAEAEVLFRFVLKVGEKRFKFNGCKNYYETKRRIDGLKPSGKTVIAIDSLESLTRYKDDVETSLISLLQKGYAGGVCLVMGAKDGLINTYFMQSIASCCPNIIDNNRVTSQKRNISPEESDMLLKAVEFVINSGCSGIIPLQRHFKISYSQAADLVELMMKNGIVGRDEFGRMIVLAKDFEEIKKRLK